MRHTLSFGRKVMRVAVWDSSPSPASGPEKNTSKSVQGKVLKVAKTSPEMGSFGLKNKKLRHE